jgi:hypothetical protein
MIRIFLRVRSQESEITIKSEPARTFQDLVVWQKAHQFVLSLYRSTEGFPKRETSSYGGLKDGDIN